MKKYEDCVRTNTLFRQRSMKGITQKVLADASGVNIRQIQKYESGEYDCGNMTLKNAVALSKALNCKVEDLL